MPGPLKALEFPPSALRWRVGTSFIPQSRFATASVGNGCLLDSRRALYHETQNWLAVADVHFGYELNRARQHGALPPQWGMAATEQRLVELLSYYRPATLIMVGDIMDGGGSIRETMKLLRRLRTHVAELVCVEGNHDRAALKRDEQFVPWHRGEGFVFQHGHRFAMVLRATEDEPAVHITGHAHPALPFSDGAGLKLKLPVLVQDRIVETKVEHWILPAFSPWAGGAVYHSRHERLATWACTENQVVKAAPDGYGR